MSDQLLLFFATAIPFGTVLAYVMHQWKRDRKELAETRDARARAEAEAQAVRQATDNAQKSFEALAAEALKSNSEAFLGLAKGKLEEATKDASHSFQKETEGVKKLVDPLQKALEKYELQITDMERRRQHAFGEIKEQLENVVAKSGEVAKQTEGLKAALTRPHVRGRWGEIQLKNCVELAGMSDYCDLSMQESSRTSDDVLIRPDMIVRMPAGRRIAVDAKVAMGSFEAYIEARTDEERHAALVEHGKHVRSHVDRLSRKEYWDSVAGSPDFVVMFLPNESFLYAALETQRDLIEMALEKKVLIASPPNLVGLLKVIYYGWREQRLAEDAQKIANEGKDLVKRIGDVVGNFTKLDKALHTARESYEAASYNLNSKVLSSARRLEALGARTERLVPDLPISSLPRPSIEIMDEAPKSAVVETESPVLESEASS